MYMIFQYMITSAIDKSVILNIHNNLMTNNNIKESSALLSKSLLYYWVLVNL